MASPGERIVMLDPYNGGLAVVRRLVRRGDPVVVVAGPVNGFSSRTRGVESHIAPIEDWPDLLRSLAPATILTGADAASAFLAERHSELGSGVRCFEAADEAHLPLLRKDDSVAIARRAGVAVPWSAEVAAADDAAEAAREVPYPAIVKPVLSHAWRGHFGDERVFLCDDADAVRRAVGRGLEKGLAMQVGEYIPGGDDCVEEAIVVRAPDGSYPVSFGCKKIRQYPPGFGAASLCKIAELPESRALAEAVLDETAYVGVAGVETKRHAVTGRRYFLEVNVRIPTQWGLGDAGGLDSSARLAAVARGESVGPQPPLRRAARLVFPELEARAAVRSVRAVPFGRRPEAMLALLRSYRGVREFGLLDLRDPGPLAAYVGRALRNRMGS